MALKILFAASGEFGVPSLSALMDAGHEILGVISQPDRPAGRGRELTPTPIARLAIERGLRVLKIANINQEKLEAADLLVVIAFGQKIAPQVVNHPRLGSVNLHASLLPKYRGAAPINWAIIKGEPVSGTSVIRLAQKMDAGAILGQHQVEIGSLETAGQLHDRLAASGAELLTNVVKKLEEGTIKEREQDEKLATAAPKLNRDASQIEWDQFGQDIARKIRGMYPWPGCRVRVLRGEKEMDRMTLVTAAGKWQEQSDLGQTGVIQDDLTIAAIAGSSVVILEVQPEGKKPMTLAAYRNGHLWEPGMRIESL
jgi:methionyl-tRNA formyltransferase